MKRFLRLLPPAMIALAAVACGDDGSSGKGGGTSVGPNGEPLGPDGKPAPPKLDGRYEIYSAFDLTDAGVLPNVANGSLKALSNFREHPSQTMVDLLDAARVPVVSNVLAVIPDAVRSRVLGWLDDHFFTSLYQDLPVTQQIAGLLDDLASLATKFEIVSTLELPPGDATGNSQATHAITGVAYTWTGKRTVVRTPAQVTTVSRQTPSANAVALAQRSPDLESGRLEVGDHKFTVPIGTFAVSGADAMARDKFGAKDLRDALGMMVDCPGMASAVAQRCVGSICVDHQAEMTQLCETGLDVVVQTVQDELRALDVPLLHLKTGIARMWDAPAPGGPLDAIVDRIDQGFWSAEVGREAKPLLTTFTGVRVGDATAPAASGSSTK